MRTYYLAILLAAKTALAFVQFPTELKQHYLIPHNQGLSAKSYLLIDADTMTILDAHNADEKMPPASLTKMMSAQIVVESLNHGSAKLDDLVKVSENASKTVGSRMFLEANSSVPLSELLKGAIVASGNDATIALAEYISGTESQFVDIMNHKASEYGLTDTHFVTATGLPDPEHYSTATDMAKLGLVTLNSNSDIYKIYSEKWYTYNKIKQSNRNRLLWKDTSVDGIKSGHTTAAGYCLVGAAKRGDMRLISVVLGTPNSSSRDHDSQRLIDYGFRFFEDIILFEKDAIVKHVPVRYGEKSEAFLTTNNQVRITIPRGASSQIETKIILNDENIKAPVDPSTPIGHLEIFLHGQKLNHIELFPKEKIDKASWFKRQWQWATYLVDSWINV